MKTPLIETLRLLTWLSPAFPTGAYAYSQGLEWAVEAGDITDAATLVDWLTDLLARGSLRNDAILLRHAWRTEGSLADLAAFATATATSRERAEETLAQGAAFRRAVAVWHPSESDLPLPVAVGASLRRGGIDETTACAAYLHAAAASLVSAGVRLIPLGQTDGLRTQATLEFKILETTRDTATATLDDIGGSCLRADIAAMRHERQVTRLFRS